MADYSKLKEGEVLSEIQFYTVKRAGSNELELKTDEGEEVKVSKHYAEKFLVSADQFKKIEKITRTELAEKVMSSPRIAITVNFNKAIKEADIKKGLHALYPNKGKMISHAEFKKNVNATLNLKGEERTMIGRHYGDVDGTGRLKFIDMKVTKGIRQRLVDPRTLNWAIIDNVKYQVK